VTDQPEHPSEVPAEDRAIGDRLTAERPVPGAGFRGALGRLLAAEDPGYGPRPARLWLISAASVVAGAALVAVAALQATGSI
jgi:hypothetical protein